MGKVKYNHFRKANGMARSATTTKLDTNTRLATPFLTNILLKTENEPELRERDARDETERERCERNARERSTKKTTEFLKDMTQ